MSCQSFYIIKKKATLDKIIKKFLTFLFFKKIKENN